MKEERAAEVDGLRVVINGRVVLDGVDLHLERGERVALVGVSGSGKSMTAAAVAGVLPPHAVATGQVRVNGHQVLAVSPARRPPDRRVGLVRQDPAVALNPMVRVGTQLAHPQRRRLGRRGAREAALQLLARAAFADPEAVMRRYPGELSGGQRQRICIVLALAAGAGLLVADEPTTALDVVTQAEVLGLLRGETGPGSAALLFVTHDLAVAASLCDRTVVLDAGRVVEDGATAAVLQDPVHHASRALVDAARQADRLAWAPAGSGSGR